MSSPREDAIDIFSYALRESRVERALEARMCADGDSLLIDELSLPLTQYRRCVLIAMGKAAGPMSHSFLKQAGRFANRFEGIIVAPELVAEPSPVFKVYRGGHPTPNEQSIQAADEILHLLEPLAHEDLVIFLISGGGSSLVERFLEPASLEETKATHKALVESGAPITAMNAVRKHLSAVKGGRLALAAAPARQVTIMVSDVPANQPDTLASGPTLPDRSSVEDVYRIAEEYRLAERFPLTVAQHIKGRLLCETPKPGDAAFARSDYAMLLDSTSLEDAAARRAEQLGWQVTIDNTCDDWPADKAVDYLLGRLRQLAAKQSRVCLVSAGEITVTVPPGTEGKGGRGSRR